MFVCFVVVDDVFGGDGGGGADVVVVAGGDRGHGALGLPHFLWGEGRNELKLDSSQEFYRCLCHAPTYR